MDCFKMYISDLGILIQVDENETTEESWGCFIFHKPSTTMLYGFRTSHQANKIYG